MSTMKIPIDSYHSMHPSGTVTIIYEEDGQITSVTPPDTSPYLNPPIRPGRVGPSSLPLSVHVAHNTQGDESFTFVPDNPPHTSSRHTIQIH